MPCFAGRWIFESIGKITYLTISTLHGHTLKPGPNELHNQKTKSETRGKRLARRRIHAELKLIHIKTCREPPINIQLHPKRRCRQRKVLFATHTKSIQWNKRHGSMPKRHASLYRRDTRSVGMATDSTDRETRPKQLGQALSHHFHNFDLVV